MHLQYGILPYEDLRLHTAALEGDLHKVKLLVQNGFNVQSRDIFFSTPLHLAAFNGHNEIAAYLIQAGAKVDSESYQEITPLLLAVKNKHLDMVSLLLKAGADPNYASASEHSPYLFLLNQLFYGDLNLEASYANIEIFKALADPEFGEPIIKNSFNKENIPASILLSIYAKSLVHSDLKFETDQVLEDITISSLHNLYLNTKNLLHTFPIKKQYLIEIPEVGTLKINAEGHWRYWTTSLARESIDNYLDVLSESQLELKSKTNLKYSIFSEIHDILWHSENSVNNGFSIGSTQAILKQINSDQIVLLPTGWDGHFVTILLYHDYFVVCNSGQRFDLKPSGAMIYKMTHPELLDDNLISNILLNNHQMDLEYDLHYKLGLKLVDFIEFPDQEFGNCAWHSFLPAIESMLFLKLSDIGIEREHAKIMATDYFNEWHHFHKSWILETYLENHADTSFEILMNILIGESNNTDDSTALERADLLVDTLSNPPFDGALADFINNQPIGWLGIADKLIDIPETIDYNNFFQSSLMLMDEPVLIIEL